MSAPATLAQAARELGIDRTTLQGWLRRGAPCIRPGDVGRGRGALVDVQALRTWRGGGTCTPQLIDVQALAAALLVTFRRPPEGWVAPAWAELGLSRNQAAALIVVTYGELVRELTGTPIGEDDLPSEMRMLSGIFVSSR